MISQWFCRYHPNQMLYRNLGGSSAKIRQTWRCPVCLRERSQISLDVMMDTLRQWQCTDPLID